MNQRKAFLVLMLGMALSLSAFVTRPSAYTADLDEPVTINGQPLIEGRIDLYTQGTLAVMARAPYLPDHKAIPFRLTIQRAGSVVRQWPSEPTQKQYVLPLNDLWPYTRLGDELVLETIGKSDRRVRRVIKLNQVWFKWLPQKGC